MPIPYPPGEALTCRQIHEIDILAIEHLGLPGIVLMENAGRAAAEFIYGLLPNPAAARVAILCGPGNNGGDGFVIARHLANAGVPLALILAAPPEKSLGDAATNLAVLARVGLPLRVAADPAGLAVAAEEIAKAALIVDALLGTGARGAPRGSMAELIVQANAARATRIAIDIPSGLEADSGTVGHPCFQADATVTMVAPKIGFETAAAAGVLGRVVVVEIGVPRALIPGRPSDSALDS